MNKRSAMLMAAGLVLTLIVGGVAMSTGLTGPTPSRAAPRAERRQTTAPIVKTVKRTVTVHKQGSATPAPATSTATGSPGSTSVGSLSGSTDDDHGSDSDDAEGEDHGGDDLLGEDADHGDDHSGSGHGGDDRTAS